MTEYHADGGHTIYNYNTSSGDDPMQPIAVYGLGEPCDAQTPNYPAAPRPYNEKAGRLLQEIVMGADGSQKQITLYDETFERQAEEVPGLIYTTTSGGTPFITWYQLYLYKLTEQKVTTYLYDQNDASKRVETIATTRYDSERHNMSTSQTTEVNDGTLRQEFSYPNEFTRSTQITESSRTTYESDLQSNLDAFNQATSSCNFNSSCWYTAFKEREREDLEERAVYAQRNVNERNQAITNLNSDYNAAGDSYQAVINLVANTQIGQPLETVSYHDGLFLESRYTEYEDKGTSRSEGQSEVYPSQSFLLQTDVPLNANQFSALVVSNNDLVKDTDYVLDASMRYENGRMVELTPRSGIPTSYVWGYDNKLPVARVDNSGYDPVTTLVDLASLQNMDGDNLRSELDGLRSLTNALVTTYTYDPLWGMTSQTDPAGMTMFYEYDALGRLYLIKDLNQSILQRVTYYYGQEGSTEP